MLRMELPRKRKRARHKGRCTDAVVENMAVVEVTEEDAEYRKLRCGDPKREKPKVEE